MAEKRLPGINNLSLILISLLGFFLSACLGGGQAPIYSPDDQQQGQIRTFPGAETKKRQTTSPPPVKKNYYRVARGDTLYSIAWRFKRDYKQLAQWNNIRSPYLIHPGQELRLIAPINKPTKAREKVIVRPLGKPTPENNQMQVVRNKADLKKTDQAKVDQNKANQEKIVGTSNNAGTIITKNTPAQNTIPPVKPTLVAGKITWQWPTRGTILNSNTASGRNGLDIKGKMGQAIKAAAPGNVVYSGSGLVGYGRLIIIKHNNSFLSAYAHNSRVLVNEGNNVLAGQPIAEMGNSGTNTVKLHFEIRKDGKSVNPIHYLPK